MPGLTRNPVFESSKDQKTALLEQSGYRVYGHESRTRSRHLETGRSRETEIQLETTGITGNGYLCHGILGRDAGQGGHKSKHIRGNCLVGSDLKIVILASKMPV